MVRNTQKIFVQNSAGPSISPRNRRS